MINKEIIHDINNLLNTIVKAAENAAQKRDASKIKPYLKTIEDNAFKISKILMQNKKNRNTGIAEMINISELLNKQAEQFALVEAGRVEVIVEVDENLWNIRGNTLELERVFSNLLKNSCEAIESNGKITIQIKNVILNNSNTLYPNLATGKYISIKIIDNGSGICEKDIPNLFLENFSTKSTDEHSGIGLFNVKSIIENHGGKVFVSSSEGEGAVFEILLPAIPSGSARENKIRIMLVEDEVTLNELLTDDFIEYGFNVVNLLDGKSAVRLFGSDNDFDLILIDYNLPDITGLETASKIREIDKSVPLIILSGSKEEGMLKKASNLNINEIILKPFSSEYLFQKIEKIINA